MRIAICGTHGTGKTTLARALSERLGVPMVEEVARTVIRQYGFSNTRDYIDKANKELKRIVQDDILAAQIEHEKRYECFVADRSVFDAVAYSQVYGVDKDRVNIMVGKAISHALNTYDLIVYVQPFWAPNNDGFRDIDIDLWFKVDVAIRRYIKAFDDFGGNVLENNARNFEERIEGVKWALKRLEEKFATVS